MISNTLISLDQGDDGGIDEYLGEFLFVKDYCLEVVCVLPYIIHFYDFLEEKMSMFPLAERKERLARKKGKCHSMDNPQSLVGG